MALHGLHFIAFLLAVLLVFHGVLRSWRSRKLFLLAASWLFYATWSPLFLPLLVVTTALDFALARRIHRDRHAPRPGEAVRPERARALLVFGLVANLGALALFKYGRFFHQSVAAVLPLPEPPAWLAVAAPLGISFYTFHAISYLVDTHRGARPPADDFVDFALYLAFFPQLLAGPITRWGYFAPQLEAPRRLRIRAVDEALLRIATGLVKKVVLADTLGGFVDAVYADPGSASSFEALVAVWGYAFQIYFDFSGYTDVAIGLAALLGFRLPENFRYPYLASSPADFWRRWHISLSTWLRDYLYIPLGGNRRGEVRTYENLLATMLLAGLWHGAAWSFVVWGGVHGVWLVAHRFVTRGAGPAAPAGGAAIVAAPRTPLWLRRLATFHGVALLWVLFRAGSLSAAGEVVHALFAGRPASQPFPIAALAVIAIGVATHATALRIDLARAWARLPRVARGASYGFATLAIWLCSTQSDRFIYFEF
jgi:D-alanyl-lipoteichoic acid acyltransferase DltB (MBOAT superfamily)